MRILTERDIGFAAALFEGEGTIGKHSQGAGARIRIRMTDLEPLERMHRTWGGTLSGPQWGANSTKPFYEWALVQWDQLCEFVRIILTEGLSLRRQQQIEKALSQPRPKERVADRIQWVCSPLVTSSPVGRRRHRDKIEPVCDVCRESYNTYNRQWAARRKINGITHI